MSKPRANSTSIFGTSPRRGVRSSLCPASWKSSSACAAERMGSRAATFEDQAAFEAEKEKLEAKVRVGHIKIVDFDKEKDMEAGRPKAEAAAGHVKVTYFDD